MALFETHVTNKPLRRGANLSQQKLDEYDRVQRLIEEVQVDMVNGVLRSEIFNKFRDRKYENLGKKDIGERQIQNYIKAAWEMIRLDRIDKIQELRDILFSQYMAQYNEATKSGNVMAAKSCLDSIAKTFLPDEKNASIQINSAKDGNITINFGYTEEEDADKL